MPPPSPTTRALDEFFAGRMESRRIFDALCAALATIGSAEMRVTTSQIAFRRRVAFAWAWIPEKYLRRPCAPLVLSVGLREAVRSPRFKEVVQPARGRFTHHMELYSSTEIDDEVVGWLRRAWEEAR